MRSIAASGIFGRTAVFDGLGSLRPSERNGVELKSAKMKRNGVERMQIDESGQRCGGSVPIQTERRAELAQSLSEWMVRLGDAGVRAALATC